MEPESPQMVNELTASSFQNSLTGGLPSSPYQNSLPGSGVAGSSRNPIPGVVVLVERVVLRKFQEVILLVVTLLVVKLLVFLGILVSHKREEV